MLPIKSWSSEGNSWSCPLPTDRLRGILEAACHWGASRVTLVDAQGRERVKVDGKIITELRRGSRSNKSHPVAADVIVRGELVGRITAIAPPHSQQDPESAIQLVAGQLAAAWSAAVEVASLAAETERAYAGLHFLHGIART